jgi:hypothetical protein
MRAGGTHQYGISPPKRENLDRLRSENFIGAGSATWLRDVAKGAEPDGSVSREKLPSYLPIRMTPPKGVTVPLPRS